MSNPETIDTRAITDTDTKAAFATIAAAAVAAQVAGNSGAVEETLLHLQRAADAAGRAHV